MRPEPLPAAMRVVSTLVIAGVLLLQGQAVFPVRRIWPFLDYPMYRTAHHEGEGVPRYQITAQLAGGREVEMDPRSLGLSFFKHLHGPIEALIAGERRGRGDVARP